MPDARLVWSGARVVAFEDLYPVSPGHTLLVPRRHVATWFDADADEQAELLAAVAAVKARLDARSPRPDGYNVGFNAGAAAGQTVMHLHVHVIPRFAGDMPDPRGGVRGVIPARQKYGGPPPGEDPFSAIAAFHPGEEHPLLDALRRAIAAADEIDLLAAFVQPSGLDPIEEHLLDALDRGARVRLLTGDYLGVTHPHALQRLLTLTTRDRPIEARLYRVGPGEVFHPKAYLFAKGPHGLALVGSSNLSRTALTTGVEWNVRAGGVTVGELGALRARFERLFTSPRAVPLTREVIADYRQRVPERPTPAPEPAAPPPTPHRLQAQALAALADTRRLDQPRGLVVMATGLGKTLLAAFDFAQSGGRRALFVAHRDEILTQAAAAWARVLPDRAIGFFTGERKEPDADLVFASVATLRRREHLERFAPDTFDYLVIDEFHHAAAESYRRILEHFQPGFVLGLTATPDRTDGAMLQALCGDNVVTRIGLVEGIRAGLLAPFAYHGVADDLDYANIPWRNGRFDLDELTARQATHERAAQALRELDRHAPAPRRALVFCVSTRHADFMAAWLTEHGVPALAVHSGPTSAPRAESIQRLRDGQVQALVAVDLFNEGFDVPDVDTILMLRPTESGIVFLQQLGRGLRKAGADKVLRVVDFIGNHKSFLLKPHLLATLAGESVAPGTDQQAVARLRDPAAFVLPPGCSVDVSTEALDLLERLIPPDSTDVLIRAYERFATAHGRRPTACELLADTGSLRRLDARFDTWFDFVADRGGLADAEARVLDTHRAWFRDVASTAMSRSYKMVALRVLDDADALHGEIGVRELADRCRAALRRDPTLRDELAEHDAAGGSLDDFVRRWREMPLRVFHRADGFSRRWFELVGDRFASRLGVAAADQETFDLLTAELVDLRLARYRLGRRPERLDPAVLELAVSHSGGRPILFFDRARQPELPEGDTPVDVDGELLTLGFRSIAVNVATARPGGPNVLGERLRGWFGPDAGAPGTRHRVQLERTAAGDWRLRPLAANTRMVELPFLALRAACGLPADTFTEPEATTVTVAVTRPVDPRRHFVVRADGSSMDGGRRPLRAGQRVLCERLAAPDPAEVEGRAVLLVATRGEEGQAWIKEPVRRDGRWWLRSANPAFPEVPLDEGVELRVVGRVVEALDEPGR